MWERSGGEVRAATKRWSDFVSILSSFWPMLSKIEDLVGRAECGLKSCTRVPTGVFLSGTSTSLHGEGVDSYNCSVLL